MSKIYPVILSGGSGTRLWPTSRIAYPKQLLPLVTENSMLQETALRVRPGERFEPPLVIANNDHRFIIAEQLRLTEIEPLALVLEPEGRNTAPAIAAAALLLAGRDPEALLLVLPSDHAIQQVTAFHEAVDRAADLAQQGHLVTFGIRPERPDTGMGYIRSGERLSAHAAAVAAFVEKPTAEVAKEYLASGAYTWNSGMFVFTAQAYLGELERLQPAIVEACRAAVDGAARDLAFLRLEPEAFGRAPAISIDYAVMEKTAKAAVVACDIGWSDVGSWQALWEIAGKDGAGNVAQGDVALHDTRDSYVRADHRLVATLGIKDVVIVESADAVLVAARQQAQDVRALVDALKQRGRHEVAQHRRVYRPWGCYEGICEGPRFQVKRITVKPGAKLSLQKHHHRAEHWIVVRGTAEVVRGEETILLHENESTYIPVGMAHRLGNPGRIELELIEVQSGSYLGEDDIIRLDDVYGRENETPKER